METYIFEILLCHLQHIARVGKEDIASFTVFSHVLIFSLFEVFEFFLVVAFYPACFVEMYWLPTAFRIVLVLKSVLYDFKLQLAYGADDFTAVKLVDEKLCYAFVHKLANALFELF